MLVFDGFLDFGCWLFVVAYCLLLTVIIGVWILYLLVDCWVYVSLVWVSCVVLLLGLCCIVAVLCLVGWFNYCVLTVGWLVLCNSVVCCDCLSLRCVKGYSSWFVGWCGWRCLVVVYLFIVYLRCDLFVGVLALRHAALVVCFD